MEDEALVMSFDHRIIRELRSAAPRIAAGILYAARLVDPIGAARGAAADAVCVQWGYLDRDVVDSAHRAGLGVFVWTVDDEQAIGRCRDLGVDGITSNDTRLLTRLLRSLARFHAGGRTPSAPDTTTPRQRRPVLHGLAPDSPCRR